MTYVKQKFDKITFERWLNDNETPQYDKYRTCTKAVSYKTKWGAWLRKVRPDVFEEKYQKWRERMINNGQDEC
jgi:hypothetical protein